MPSHKNEGPSSQTNFLRNRAPSGNGNILLMSLAKIGILGLAGTASMLAGASLAHHFLQPDLALPPPPPELVKRLERLRSAQRDIDSHIRETSMRVKANET